ncbi:MAG: beta-propeller domain-containing protein [Oscillospiraceae bacterium]|jgi:uncharacterized secreted protein with C-terminal beta-propeller domain|nr:beta-propeller domain-containing protein [Oscillospiraceae bacterium]
MKKKFLFSGAALIAALSILLLSGGGSSVLPLSGSGAVRLPQTIVSDGEAYTVRMIDSVKVETKQPEREETLPVVGDKKTLLKLLKERGALTDSDEFTRYTSGGAENKLSDAEAPMAAAEPEMAADSASFSGTNEQVAGVSEGDIVKTDGVYLYALSDNKLRIIRAADLTVVSVIELSGNLYGQEFYLIGDKLAVVAQEYADFGVMPDGLMVEPAIDSTAPNLPPDTPAAPPAPESDVFRAFVPQRNFSLLLIYDITDREAPYEARRVHMDGWMVATRVVGDTVYLVSNKSVWTLYGSADSQDILPYTRDSAAGEDFAPVGYNDIYYVPGTNDGSYLLIGAINVNENQPFEPKAYLGAGSQLYMSAKAIYLTQTRYNGEFLSGDDSAAGFWQQGDEFTDILRFDVEGGEIYYGGMGTVPGSPISQYSMDEYNGFFRIATTAWQQGTFVSVLDAGLHTVGQVGPLMPEERMQSMRFMGTMGYIVTYENTDPLFTIDLSNPIDPRVLGELKIPGFSQYLHPVGDGLLLGIGRDTQELYTRDKNGVETVVGAQDVGMKVSLFDVSDPFNPFEADVLSLGEGYAEVSHNPRALMTDPERGLYGFLTERWSRDAYGSSALLLRVSGRRLSVANEIRLNTSYMYNGRLCFIGGTLYIVMMDGVASYDYNTFAELGRVHW